MPFNNSNGDDYRPRGYYGPGGRDLLTGGPHGPPLSWVEAQQIEAALEQAQRRGWNEYRREHDRIAAEIREWRRRESFANDHHRW